MSTRHWVVALVGLGLAFGASSVNGRSSAPDVVIEWNELIQSTAAGGSQGPLQVRFYAATHVAMFDAVNSIAREYAPFHARVAASSGASMEAAAAQAAYDVLLGLTAEIGAAPSAQWAATLAQHLASVPPGLREQGVAVGHAVAARVLAWRVGDGAVAADDAYALPVIAGLWQPAPAPVSLSRLRYTAPFALLTRTQFMVSRHPELDSDRYEQDFNEVKAVGKSDSLSRTEEQTRMSRAWAGVPGYTTQNVFGVWNGVLRDAAAHMTLVEAARAFALLNVSLFDGLLTSQNGKFAYGLWRPVTAIRNAASYPNPGTAPDATWSPLLGTPPYPTYPGNMACIGAAAAETMRNVTAGDGAPLTVEWHWTVPSPGSESRVYPNGYQDLAQEEADSRIWGGIHFRFDNEASQAVCMKVADWAEAKVHRMP